MKKTIYALLLLAVFSSCVKNDDEEETPEPTNTVPTAIVLESIQLTGFDQTNSSGAYWDTSTNPPDPFVVLSKGGATVFTSGSIPNASFNTTYDLSTASSGALPVTYAEGLSLQINVRDLDSPTMSESMGYISIDDALSFFDNGDGATRFEDVQIITSNGSVELSLSGSIVY